MFLLHSNIENNIYPLFVLEDRLKPGGFITESNWDYKEGYVDFSYQLMRMPMYHSST
ncbi:YugN family protein [Lentibacillus sp. CBA3610]|uniref:YugN family protein n=1 Tax=Lentibacillus sp. CBA3610 TaxID=2518176 RepID=UPI001595B1D7|nr:YugN family protein [Lentibacillus sp. CBA3610]QKY69770.1 hypothetical protein Len3610_09335 [Lentibacillus sp. CBA3610]